MKVTYQIGLLCSAWILSVADLSAQRGGRGNDPEVPLMRPDEEARVNRQSDSFNRALGELLVDASKSTVRVWSGTQRLAYGTVVGDGSQVLTKWSEIRRASGALHVEGSDREVILAVVVGVNVDEDLALLDLEEGGLVAAAFFEGDLDLGKFLVAPQPDGRPAAFGVVSVRERNLRETDQAHLGIMADERYQGTGVRVREVQTEYGAAAAGIRPGDVILKVDERRVSGLQELRNALSDKQPQESVVLLVEAAGREREVEVILSNRPMLSQFSGGRLTQMEVMGGPVSNVRSGFSRVVQTDMRMGTDQVGGPVVDLQGRIVGITMARADRTRSFVMGGAQVVSLLKKEWEEPSVALEKLAMQREEREARRRDFVPRAQPQGRPPSRERMGRHLGDLQRLRERLDEEMAELGGR